MTFLLADSFGTAGFSWNPITDFNNMWAYDYMRHAFAAGLIVAFLGGVIGWYAILRSETYATHTLSMVGFPGATGAALIGVSPLLGYFTFCLAGAFAIPTLSGRNRHGGGRQNESAAVGSVQALALALGLLFVSLYHGYLNGVSTFLFGTFTGITSDQVIALFVVAVIAIAAIGIIHRRLLFASIDPATAQAAGISVRRVELVFLVLLALAIAETSQFTGALLAFTLTITPAAIAQTLTVRPNRALATSVALGILFAWTGLVAAYYTDYPVGFFVTSIAFVVYVIARLWAFKTGRR